MRWALSLAQCFSTRSSLLQFNAAHMFSSATRAQTLYTSFSLPPLYTRFFLRAPLLIATKPVLIGVTERLAPQLLHCMK